MFSASLKIPAVASLCLAVALSAQSVWSGEYDSDRAGGKDHPVVSRYAGSMLYMYGDENYGTTQIMIGGKSGPALQPVEGRLSNKIYWGPKGRSSLEIFRNYQQALQAAGFETLYACETAQCEKFHVQNLIQEVPRKAYWAASNSGLARDIFNSGNQPSFYYLSARKVNSTGTVHIQLGLAGSRENDSVYQGRVRQFVQIVESAAVDEGKVTVDAKEITASLKRDGKIALYGILFDTNKAIIKEASGPALEEMAKALKAEPALKVFIVGHTDNQGTLENNLPLSQKRAEAVVEALKNRYGISPDRISAHGIANFAPVANNASEEGRTKNRRVEMVVR